MISFRNKRIVASIVVGILGAGIAGFLTLALSSMSGNEKVVYAIQQFVVPVSMIAGFFSCLVLSMRYLRSMENRVWREGRRSGILYGGWAGAVSGFITGFLLPFVESTVKSNVDTSDFILSPLMLAGGGFCYGGGTGFVLAYIFAPFVLKFIVGTPKPS